MMKRLGKNSGGYFGEQIDISKVLDEIELAAHNAGWGREVFHKVDGLPLFAFKKSVTDPQRKIYISAGIHGDEPAAPLAALRLLAENHWPANADIWLLPCLNPVGYKLGKRENARGIDLNRQYLHKEAEETKAHIAWLETQSNFDVCVSLHEDWESSGFYLYELNPESKPSFAQKMVAAVKEVCPIDMAAEIEGRPSNGGIINPNLDPRTRPLWPESFYLIMNHTRLAYTLEAPSDYELPVRVNALTNAVRAVLS